MEQKIYVQITTNGGKAIDIHYQMYLIREETVFESVN